MDQEAHVNTALSDARAHGVTHLLHIDDDELLYLPSGRTVFDAHVNTPERSAARCLVVKNVEAVAPHVHVTSPFHECFFFRTDPSTFTAYANGKSMGVISERDVKGSGAHRFRGSVSVDEAVALILHYESMVVENWLDKFARIARVRRDTGEDVDIPFRFYKDSLRVVGQPDAVETWRTYKVARSFESLQHIHPSFTGASVLLVGNGPSLRGVDISMFVEAFPTVVRFNGFEPSERLGRKTTVWCISDTVAVNHQISRESDTTLCIIPLTSPYANSASTVAKSLSHRSNVTIYEATSSSPTSWPSTGILALEYFLSANPTSAIFVCGFDHFSTHPIHHYENTSTSSHASKDEARAFDYLVRTSGRVFRLPLDDSRRIPATLNHSFPGLSRLHNSPDVFVVSDFLSPNDCRFVTSLARKRLKESTVVGSVAGAHRNSKTAFLYDRCDWVLERVRQLTGIPVTHMEIPQVTYYHGPNMQYKRHVDAPDETTPAGREFCRRGGNRIVTVLIYLNDVPQGGETMFDFASVSPIRGQAVVFFPCSSDGTRDLRLYHAALPTTDEKWVMQVWVRQRPHRDVT
jgi:hypothetical protein